MKKFLLCAILLWGFCNAQQVSLNPNIDNIEIKDNKFIIYGSGFEGYDTIGLYLESQKLDGSINYITGKKIEIKNDTNYISNGDFNMILKKAYMQSGENYTYTKSSNNLFINNFDKKIVSASLETINRQKTLKIKFNNDYNLTGVSIFINGSAVNNGLQFNQDTISISNFSGANQNKFLRIYAKFNSQITNTYYLDTQSENIKLSFYNVEVSPDKYSIYFNINRTDGIKTFLDGNPLTGGEYEINGGKLVIYLGKENIKKSYKIYVTNDLYNSQEIIFNLEKYINPYLSKLYVNSSNNTGNQISIEGNNLNTDIKYLKININGTSYNVDGMSYDDKYNQLYNKYNTQLQEALNKKKALGYNLKIKYPI